MTYTSAPWIINISKMILDKNLYQRRTVISAVCASCDILTVIGCQWIFDKVGKIVTGVKYKSSLVQYTPGSCFRHYYDNHRRYDYIKYLRGCEADTILPWKKYCHFINLKSKKYISFQRLQNFCKHPTSFDNESDCRGDNTFNFHFRVIKKDDHIAKADLYLNMTCLSPYL